MQEIDILDWIHGTFGCIPMDWLSLAFEYAFKTCIIWVILGILLLRRPNTRMFGLVLSARWRWRSSSSILSSTGSCATALSRTTPWTRS